MDDSSPRSCSPSILSLENVHPLSNLNLMQLTTLQSYENTENTPLNLVTIRHNVESDNVVGIARENTNEIETNNANTQTNEEASTRQRRWRPRNNEDEELDVVNYNPTEPTRPSTEESTNESHNNEISTMSDESNNTTESSADRDSNSALESKICADSTDEPPAKMRRLRSPPLKNDTESETCPICLDSWGNTGTHKLVALKCGHLFGNECIEKWLRTKQVKDRCCPTCKLKAHFKDIRHIFARKLVTQDTSRVTELEKKIEALHEEKKEIEFKLQKSKTAENDYLLQIEDLKRTLMNKQEKRESQRRWRFSLEKNLEVCKDGGCRVLAYNSRTYELYVSQKSVSNLFPGYGIRKVSCVDYALGQFINLHPKPIRDITYSQTRDLLLSVGLDCTTRVVERGVPVASVKCNMPLWSVSWDYLNSDCFYVGGGGGLIHKYDMRNPNTFLHKFNAADMSPIVSLYSTEYGILSCQLNSCWLWQENGRWKPRSLPLSGPFMSLSYDYNTHKALVLTRPTTSRSKLSICKITPSDTSVDVLFGPEQNFNISTKTSIMTKCAWVTVGESPWAAAHSESENALYVNSWDGTRNMFIGSTEPVLDVCSVQINGDSVLTPLSESKLRFYKAVPTFS